MKFIEITKYFLKGELRSLRDKLIVCSFSIKSKNCFIDSRAILRRDNSSQIIIGNNVAIGAYTVICADSSGVPESLDRTILTIGDGTYIGESNNIRAAGKTTIGRNCLISQGVSIIGSNYKKSAERIIKMQGWDEDKLGVNIGDDVWIGTNSVILPGTSIGEGAIIAAGSVVTKNIAPYEVYGGIPAKFIRQRN